MNINNIILAFSVYLFVGVANADTVNMVLKKSYLDARSLASDDGFEEFKNSVYKEPFEDGVYIVNGDTPIPSDAALYGFYLHEIKTEWKKINYGIDVNAALYMRAEDKLIVDAPNKIPFPWSDIEKLRLDYCISKDFGDRYSKVVKAMENASKAWMVSSNVRLTHQIEFDDNCDQHTKEVIFDVRPVSEGQYLARAFFPRYARQYRNIMIDDSSFKLDPNGKLNLLGILRHEIGHVLGFRHEHTRPESGKCFEDDDWVPVGDGDYDAYSVMHYPQCNGLGDWSLTLTPSDKKGAACLYGLPEGGKPEGCLVDG